MKKVGGRPYLLGLPGEPLQEVARHLREDGHGGEHAEHLQGDANSQSDDQRGLPGQKARRGRGSGDRGFESRWAHAHRVADPRDGLLEL